MDQPSAFRKLAPAAVASPLLPALPPATLPQFLHPASFPVPAGIGNLNLNSFGQFPHGFPPPPPPPPPPHSPLPSMSASPFPHAAATPAANGSAAAWVLARTFSGLPSRQQAMQFEAHQMRLTSLEAHQKQLTSFEPHQRQMVGFPPMAAANSSPGFQTDTGSGAGRNGIAQSGAETGPGVTAGIPGGFHAGLCRNQAIATSAAAEAASATNKNQIPRRSVGGHATTATMSDAVAGWLSVGQKPCEESSTEDRPTLGEPFEPSARSAPLAPTAQSAPSAPSAPSSAPAIPVAPPGSRNLRAAGGGATPGGNYASGGSGSGSAVGRGAGGGSAAGADADAEAAAAAVTAAVSAAAWEQHEWARGLAELVASDGYRWLKYGAKQLSSKNGGQRRAYYRCAASSPHHRAAGSLPCPARKVVNSHPLRPLDLSTVTVEYLAKHNHPIERERLSLRDYKGRRVAQGGDSPGAADVSPTSGADVSPTCGADVSPTCGADVSPTSGADVSPTCGADVSPMCGADVSPTSGVSGNPWVASAAGNCNPSTAVNPTLASLATVNRTPDTDAKNCQTGHHANCAVNAHWPTPIQHVGPNGAANPATVPLNDTRCGSSRTLPNGNDPDNNIPADESLADNIPADDDSCTPFLRDFMGVAGKESGGEKRLVDDSNHLDISRSNSVVTDETVEQLLLRTGAAAEHTRGGTAAEAEAQVDVELHLSLAGSYAGAEQRSGASANQDTGFAGRGKRGVETCHGDAKRGKFDEGGGSPNAWLPMRAFCGFNQEALHHFLSQYCAQ